MKYIALGTLTGLAALASGATLSPIVTEMYKDYHGIEKIAGILGAYAIPGVFVLGSALCGYLHHTRDTTHSLENTTTSSPSLPLKK